MKNVILFAAVIMLVFVGCRNSASTQPSPLVLESGSEVSKQTQSSESTHSVPTSESSNENIEESIFQSENTSHKSENQNHNNSVPETLPTEIQFHFVDKGGKPVQGLSGSILLMPDRKGGNLYAKVDEKKYSGDDGILYYWVSGYEQQAVESLLMVNSAFDSSLYKEYKIDMSIINESYELVWDLALPTERSVTQGIVLRVVDVEGNPIEGIAFKVEDIFLDNEGQSPGSGTISFTTTSDPNGIIIITPAMPVKSVFTYGSTTFEINYPTLGELVEKTITIK